MKNFDIKLIGYNGVAHALIDGFHVYMKQNDIFEEIPLTLRHMIYSHSSSELWDGMARYLNRACLRERDGLWTYRADLSVPEHGIVVLDNQQDHYFLSVTWEW